MTDAPLFAGRSYVGYCMLVPPGSASSFRSAVTEGISGVTVDDATVAGQGRPIHQLKLMVSMPSILHPSHRDAVIDGGNGDCPYPMWLYFREGERGLIFLFLSPFARVLRKYSSCVRSQSGTSISELASRLGGRTIQPKIQDIVPDVLASKADIYSLLRLSAVEFGLSADEHPLRMSLSGVHGGHLPSSGLFVELIETLLVKQEAKTLGISYERVAFSYGAGISRVTTYIGTLGELSVYVGKNAANTPTSIFMIVDNLIAESLIEAKASHMPVQ